MVLACGGFEANPEWRTRYLGPGWELAKVRGTRYNTGDGIRMALDDRRAAVRPLVGLPRRAWDLNAPPFGDLRVGDLFQKHCYPLGLIVNIDGKRFVDEGADFRNYTYAKYGRDILRSRSATAFQLFDAKIDRHAARRVPHPRRSPRRRGHDRGAGRRAGHRPPRPRAHGARLQRGRASQATFNPAVLDGKGDARASRRRSRTGRSRSTRRPTPASPSPAASPSPSAGCASTPAAQVLDTEDRPIPGLYAAGELVGGLFYHNYPGGSGLMAGAVFGRRAGTSAGRFARG